MSRTRREVPLLHETRVLRMGLHAGCAQAHTAAVCHAFVTSAWRAYVNAVSRSWCFVARHDDALTAARPADHLCSLP